MKKAWVFYVTIISQILDHKTFLLFLKTADVRSFDYTPTYLRKERPSFFIYFYIAYY